MSQYNDRSLLILVCIAQGNSKWDHLAHAIRQSRGSAQKIMRILEADGLVVNAKGPNGGGLANGRSLTRKGVKVLNEHGHKNVKYVGK